MRNLSDHLSDLTAHSRQSPFHFSSKDRKAAAKPRNRLPSSCRLPYPPAVLSSIPDESSCSIPLSWPRHLTSTQHTKDLQERRLLHSGNTSEHQHVEQNHRMVGVGRDLCGSSSSTPLPKQGRLQALSLLSKASPSQAVSRLSGDGEREHPQSLCTNKKRPKKWTAN